MPDRPALPRDAPSTPMETPHVDSPLRQPSPRSAVIFRRPGTHSFRFSIVPFQHGRRDSNPQPVDLESTALPIELHPYSCRPCLYLAAVHLEPAIRSLPASPAASLLLSRFLVDRVLPQLRAVLFQFQPLGAASLFRGAVIPLTRFTAFQPDILARHAQTLSTITRPAPQPHSSQNTAVPKPSTAANQRPHQGAFALPSNNPTSHPACAGREVVQLPS